MDREYTCTMYIYNAQIIISVFAIQYNSNKTLVPLSFASHVSMQVLHHINLYIMSSLLYKMLLPLITVQKQSKAIKFGSHNFYFMQGRKICGEASPWKCHSNFEDFGYLAH